MNLERNSSYLASHFPPGVLKIFSLSTVNKFMMRLSVKPFEFIQVGIF